MKWRVSWDLSTIPDDIFQSEVGRRRVSKRKPKPTKNSREYLNKKADSMRKLRTKRKTEAIRGRI